MERIRAMVGKYGKVYLGAVILAVICDLIGTVSINIGIGTLTMFPMVFAVILGGCLGPDALRLFNKKEAKIGGELVLVALAPFMAKMGVSAGANLAKLVEVGPALILQEFGNLGTILISLPVALLLGLKKEAIGACYSINRDANLGLTTDIYGTDAAETRGTFAVYIVGLASGVGGGSMMTAAAGTLGQIYPEYAEDIIVMGGASDMLTGVTGIYMGTFVGLPLTRKLYAYLEPRLGRRAKRG